METTKVNFRINNKTGEIFAVFLDTNDNGKYLCYSLYDGTHFDAEKSFLLQCKNIGRNSRFNINELCQYLKARNYENIIVNFRL